ncbi:hypothetical protein PCASD_19457 [Puccinia coronata f. sp. avenae]|uniref:HSF-type DNA-binding domain-containing protein n=1 Tax=Puccinia coronata f. sp. avenae TaxID=200324 RepID=A0A2N5TTZ7_9BASI|nr:hypothetical protein PCASD_19457 [Puccinia coronata f. sp. avenae]
MSNTYPNTTSGAIDSNLQSMAITKRIQPSALTVDKATAHRNTARPIPAFLTKLFTMVNDSSTDHLIKWNEPNGDSFFVVSSERFGRELLPKYFKHSNFGSFVRQLNMYGFHKVPHLNQGVLQGEIPETEMLEFTNVNFQRGQPDLLCLIQRKKPCPDSTNPTTNEPPTEASSTTLPSNPAIPHNTDIQAILVDIMSIRKHQTLMSSDLKDLQSSNAHLWKEAIANRDRIKRCQDTINKILGFLAQVFAGKVSSVEDPPLGGSSSSSSSIPDLDRHRSSRAKSSSDHHHHPHTNNNFNYNSPPSNNALSLYSQMRHPRLMLEDINRSSSNPSASTSQSLADNVSSFIQSLDSTTTPAAGHISFNSNTPSHTQGISSPTPSTRHTSSTSSSPKLDPSCQFQDSSIDPNLEPVSDANGTSGQAMTHDPVVPSSTVNDQCNADAVLQALFSSNLSMGGFNMNDNPLTGINWADLLSSDNHLNGFNEPKSDSGLNPPSPLRITDGHPTAPGSCSPPPPIDVGFDSCNQLLANTQREATRIESTTSTMDSLETDIEKLVNNLPDQMEDYLNPSELNKANQNGYTGDPLDPLDIEKFLDEWTCPDPGRILPGLTPLASPVTTPRVGLTETDARLASSSQTGAATSHGFQASCVDLAEGSSREGALNPLPAQSGGGGSSSLTQVNPLAFDLNDDDHLRRIMSSKKIPGDPPFGVTPILPDPADTTTTSSTTSSSPYPHPPRKRLRDDPGNPQPSLNRAAPPHFAHPKSFAALAVAQPSSHQQLINNKKTRL